jgi:hypothetical protein
LFDEPHNAQKASSLRRDDDEATLVALSSLASVLAGRISGSMNASSSRHDLDARARQLLRALIARYIAEGQPVGSRTLAKASGLDVSPATIRNIMSDLEEFGLVAAPHTSAGRVPTSQG